MRIYWKRTSWFEVSEGAEGSRRLLKLVLQRDAHGQWISRLFRVGPGGRELAEVGRRFRARRASASSGKMVRWIRGRFPESRCLPVLRERHLLLDSKTAQVLSVRDRNCPAGPGTGAQNR